MKFEDVWTWVVSAALITTWWVFIAMDLATALVREVHGAPASVLALILAVGAGAAASSVMLTRYLGPLRATPAEIVTGRETASPARQILGVGAVTVPVSAFALILALSLGHVRPGDSVGSIPMRSLSWVVFAACLALAILAPAVGAFLQRGWGERAPRWRLIAASSRARALTTSLVSLDPSAMRAESDLAALTRPGPFGRWRRSRGGGRPTPAKPPFFPRASRLRLPALMIAGLVRARWLQMLLVVAVPVAVLALGSMRLAMIASVASSVVLAAAGTRALASITSNIQAQRWFERPRRTFPVLASAVAIVACLLVPALGSVAAVAALSGVLTGSPFSLAGSPFSLAGSPLVRSGVQVMSGAGPWLLAAACAVVCGVVGRAAGQLSAGRKTGTVINSQELGPIPMDIVTRLLSGLQGPVLVTLLILNGWVPAAVVIGVTAIVWDCASCAREVKNASTVRASAQDSGGGTSA